MHHHPPHTGRLIAFCVALAILILLASNGVKGQASYTVPCGEDVHAAIAAAGNPLTVTFQPGCTHRLARRIDPANGQTFIGNGATLSGAKTLTGWQRAGAYWAVTGQTQEGRRTTVTGETICQNTAPRCNYPEMLFRDGRPLNHVTGLDKLGSGAWFFDYAANTITVYDDPTGRLMETSVTNTNATNCAICGAGNDVTIRGFRVVMFGTITESATLEGFTPGGQRWIIENNVIEWNGAVGAVVRTGGIIRNNTMSNNGQAGYGGGGTPSVRASNIVVESNEIAFNNWKGVNPNFSAGGGKIAYSIGATIRGNHSHHNAGTGLWTDLDNEATVYEGNRVEYNQRGIFHEMSYSATIRGNTLACNGGTADNTYQTSIVITNSSNVLIEGNTVTVCQQGNGIGVREDGSRPTRETFNVTVANNTVIFAACRGAVGQDAYLGGVLERITWRNNVYRVCDATGRRWLVEGKALTFNEWATLWTGETQIVGIPIAPTPTPQATSTPVLTPTLTVTPNATATPELTPSVTPQRLLIRFGGEFWIEVITP